MAFLASFLQYLICAVILVAVGFCGALVGRILRKSKDKKTAAAAAASDVEEEKRG